MSVADELRATIASRPYIDEHTKRELGELAVKIDALENPSPADVDRVARFLQYGLAGAHHDHADEHHVAQARAVLRVYREGRP